MKKLISILLLLPVTPVVADINLDINLKVDSHKIERTLKINAHCLKYICAENNLKFIIAAQQEDEKMDVQFQIYQKDKLGNFELIAQPHLKAEIGKPAQLEIKEEKKANYWPIIRGLRRLFGLNPMVIQK